MRIRTVKPEFWSSYDTAGLSESAALLALGLLNLADDDGYFIADCRLIRAQLAPLRETTKTTEEAFAELVGTGYVETRTGTDGKPYGRVVAFLTHQRINRPTPSKIKGRWGAHGSISEQSVSINGANTEGSRESVQGREGKGRDPP